MKLNFIKVSPTQNMTIFVMDPVSPSNHIDISNKLMDYGSLHAEQVGFIQRSGDYVRLQMMAGEFCGNATRSLAAIILDRKLGKIEEKGNDFYIKLETSGLEQVVECRVRKTDKNHVYMSEIHMPLPIARSKLKIILSEEELDIDRVDFLGISHFIVDDKKIKDRDLLYSLIKEVMDKEDYLAFGIMYYDYEDNFLIPLVYVKPTNSLYWEKSCGSGTTALGAALAYKYNTDIDRVVDQPGGQLKVKVKIGNNIIQEILLDGPVDIVAEGLVNI